MLLEIMVDENKKTRIAIVGEGGVGKTTLLAKIAHDWATENAFTPSISCFSFLCAKSKNLNPLAKLFCNVHRSS